MPKVRQGDRRGDGDRCRRTAPANRIQVVRDLAGGRTQRRSRTSVLTPARQPHSTLCRSRPKRSRDRPLLPQAISLTCYEEVGSSYMTHLYVINFVPARHCETAEALPVVHSAPRSSGCPRGVTTRISATVLTLTFFGCTFGARNRAQQHLGVVVARRLEALVRRPSSTTFPAFMTRIRSANSRTFGRSWVMKL